MIVMVFLYQILINFSKNFQTRFLYIQLEILLVMWHLKKQELLGGIMAPEDFQKLKCQIFLLKDLGLMILKY